MPWNFKDGLHWPLSNSHTVEEHTYQQAIINHLGAGGNSAVVSCLPLSALGSSHILQHDPDREHCREVQRGWAELLLWCHKWEICSSVAASAWCFVTARNKDNFLFLSVNCSLKLWLLLDFVDTEVSNPSEAGYTPVWRIQISSMPFQQVRKRRETEQHCNLLGVNGVMAGVRAVYPTRTFLHISGGCLVMHLASQSLSLSQFSAPCWQCLSQGHVCWSTWTFLHSERWDLSTHHIQVTWFNLYLFHNTLLQGVHLATPFFHFIVGQAQPCNVCFVLPFFFTVLKEVHQLYTQSTSE